MVTTPAQPDSTITSPLTSQQDSADDSSTDDVEVVVQRPITIAEKRKLPEDDDDDLDEDSSAAASTHSADKAATTGAGLKGTRPSSPAPKKLKLSPSKKQSASNSAHPQLTPAAQVSSTSVGTPSTSVPSSAVVPKSASALSAQRRSLSLANAVIRPIVFGSFAELIKKGEKYPPGHTHKWKVFVQGYRGQDISHWCSHIIFRLHESFQEPRRAFLYPSHEAHHIEVIRAPPFEVCESGWGEFEIIIELHFKDPKLRSVTLFHHLKLWPVEALPGAIAEYSQSENPKPMLADKYEELIFTFPQTLIMKEAFDSYDRQTNPPICTSAESKMNDDLAVEELKKITEAKEKIRLQLDEMMKRKEENAKELSIIRKQIHELKVPKTLSSRNGSRSSLTESVASESPQLSVAASVE